jgi:DNA-binding transcriptional regulator YiaG
MQPSEEQLTALGNYRDIILQHVPEIAEAIGVSVQTLRGWLEGKGEPTSEEAGKILDFLKEKDRTISRGHYLGRN